jgi:hypothetical protein
MKSSPETIRHAMGWPEPTTATIDHAERATQLLESASTLVIGNPQVAAILAEAQVHATLAAADEQRTANMIAISTYNARAIHRLLTYHDADDDYQGSTLGEFNDRCIAWFGIIRERLNLS